MVTVFAEKVVAAVIDALFAKTSTSKEEVGEEKLSLFLVVATVEGSIREAR
jgi:hypothetical protein